jgi:hypothetical protein
MSVKIKEAQGIDLTKNPILLMGINEYPFEVAQTAEIPTIYCNSCGAYHPGDGYDFTSPELAVSLESLVSDSDTNTKRQSTIRAIIKLKAHLSERGWPVG